MEDTIFRIAINLIIGVGTIIIIWLGARHIEALTKEVENYHLNDSTSIYYQPAIPSDSLIIE